MVNEVLYNPFHGPRLAIAVIVLCIVAVFARGADDKGIGSKDRDRAARVALALAGGSNDKAPAATAVAPSPRVKIPTYPQGYAKAAEDLRPLVVFVGIDLWPVKGAVVAQSETFAGVSAPAVVIGYPVADRLWIHATIRGIDVNPESVSKAAKEAAKKIDAPPAKAMPAPVPVDWMLRADPVKGDKEKAGKCICEDNCKCEPGKCPACPAKVAALRDTLVRVTCGNGSGSGTVIWSEDGKSIVLTAAHVVAHGAQPKVRAEGKWHAATVLAHDDAADLAALLVTASLPAVAVAEKDPAADASVMMFGVTSLWSKGKITGASNLSGREVYLLGYDSDSGDSGGGVFVAGELVGVHCGKVGITAGAEATPYCTAAKPIRSFLAKVLKREGTKTVLVVTVPVAPATPAQKVAGAPLIVGPVSGGCANGSCGAPTWSGYPPAFRRR